MTMRHFTKLAVLATILLVAGCNSTPIANVSETRVTTASSKTLSQDQVRAAIIRAASGLGWQIKDEGANKLIGSINLRTHSAEIEIPYSATNYSIKYRSSTNLGEMDGSIHKNYNGWIQNLNRGIATELSKL
ncbi:MAG: hypothetical protein ABIZ64_03115 [Casimicrobium sp.]